VVLQDIADCTDSVIEARPSFGSERFGHRDLHAGDVSAVPQRFQDRVGEPKNQQALDGFLP
jgi:hypothetical protein